MKQLDDYTRKLKWPVRLWRYAMVLVTTFLLLGPSAFAQSVPAGVVPVPLANPKAGTSGIGFGIDGDLKAYYGIGITSDPSIYPFPSIPASLFEAAGDWLPDENGKGGVLTSTGAVPMGADPKRVVHATDAYGSTDNIFKGGSKIDSNPNSVKWVTGGPNPSKNDINNALVYIAEDANGHIWAVMAGDRATKEGNSFIAFQFLQKELSKNSDGTFSSAGANGGRTAGDIQITAEFTNGGSAPNLYYEEWKLVGSTYSWVAINNPPSGAAFGRTNNVQLENVPYNPFGGTIYETNLFAEVAVDITEVYKNVSTGCIGKISTLWVVTKSSQSPSANMTDFVEPIPLDLDINVPANAGDDKYICVGGSTTIGTAGVAGYTYSWSPATGLSATNVAQPTASPSSTTTYTLTVTKTGTTCSLTDGVTVNVRSLPTASISGTTAVCKNAASPSVTFTGSGGTKPYTFTYKIGDGSNQTVSTTGENTSVTVSVPTGTVGAFVYTLVGVADANCSNTATGSATVTVRELPTASISGTTTVCKDAASPVVTFTGSGGTKPYTFTYKINNGSNLTVQTTGTNASVTVAAPTSTSGDFVYTLVSVADANCSNTATGSATVTVRELPTASISGPDPVCEGAGSPNVTFTGSGGTKPYTFTYKINNGSNLTVQTTGTNASVTVAAPTSTSGDFVYTLVSVADVNCSNTATGSATVTINDEPIAPTVCIVQPDLCGGAGSVTIIGPTGEGYMYSIDDGTTWHESNVFANLAAGSVTGIRVKSDKGCISPAADCSVSSCESAITSQSSSSLQSIEQPKADDQLTAYPIPFSERTTLEFKAERDGNYEINLYDMKGTLIRQLKSGTAKAGEVTQIEVDGRSMADGMYLARMVSGSGAKTVKLLKKNR